MRPWRFREFAVDTLKNTPGVVSVEALGTPEDPKLSCGIGFTTAAGPTRWGIVGQLPEGARHDTPDADPGTTGTPAPAGAPPQPEDSPEAYFAAAIAQAESPEIAKIDRWSVREDARQGQIGMTVLFHAGDRVFVRQL